MPNAYALKICKPESLKKPKKLRLRSWKVRKRHGTVIGVGFRGKIQLEQVGEKTPVGKP